MTSPILVHNVGLNAFGRLVENQERRLEQERTADCELLLAAGEVAVAVQYLLQHGKHTEHLRRNRAQSVPADPEAETQILLDRQLGKDLAPLRHVANAEARPLLDQPSCIND
jgi:hypothetical protein